MKKCPYCGKDLSDTAIRCMYCRKALPEKEAEQGPSFFVRMVNTWKLIVFKPKEFFSTIVENQSHPSPLLFVAIIIIIGMIFGLLSLIISGRGESMILGVVFLNLVLIPVGIYIETAIMQFFAHMLKGQGDFDTSLKIIAYSQATLIFNIIPMVGGLIAAIWGAVIAFIGIKKLHKLDTGKSVLVLIFSALLIPFIGLIILFSSWLVKPV